MSINKLTKLIRQPEKPIMAVDADRWHELQTELRIVFPDDYFKVIAAYGCGRFFGDSFTVANPADPTYADWLGAEKKTLAICKDSDPDLVPYDVHPQEPGLYPFGQDDNGNGFYWLTRGAPNEWPIVCRPNSFLNWQQPISISLTDFLVSLCTNKLNIKYDRFWGNRFTSGDHDFESHSPPKTKKPRR